MGTVATAREVITRYCDAWQRGDMPALVDCYSEGFTLHYFGRSPLAGDHVGKPAALATLAKATQLTGRQLLEIHDSLASDDHAVVLARERFQRDGKSLDVSRVLVYHVKDGRLSECWLYDDDQRAVDEFWGMA